MDTFSDNCKMAFSSVEIMVTSFGSGCDMFGCDVLDGVG